MNDIKLMEMDEVGDWFTTITHRILSLPPIRKREGRQNELLMSLSDPLVDARIYYEMLLTDLGKRMW